MDGWIRRYLALLGVEHRAPGLESLGRLVRAQVLTIPFENTAALLRRAAAGDGPVAPLDPEALLASWEARSAGGVCFEHTEAFGRLLVALGYPVTPVAGELSFPGSHQALMVEAGGASWLVDVGNGAPFLEPIPLDRPLELRRAGLGYRFRADPDHPDHWLQERALAAGWTPFCRYRLRPQSPADRAAAYQRHHRPRETWVTNSIVLTRTREHEVIAFRNGDQVRHTPEGKVAERVEHSSAWSRLPALVGLPALPLAAVIRAWSLVNGQPPPPGAPLD